MSSGSSSAAWSRLDSEASEIVAAAAADGLTLRVVGSTGVHLHCARAAGLQEAAERQPKDIDFITLSRDRNALRSLIEGRGYEIDRGLMIAMEGKRFSFNHPQTGMELDVFVDQMEFCHTIDLTSRLELHPRTVPVEDLLLQKLQVHELTRNDMVDALVLLASHPLRAGGSADEEIDADYIAGLLAKDWGFHHTVTRNLAQLQSVLAQSSDNPLDAASSSAASDRAGELLQAIDGAKKTTAWRLRARVGERVKWWEEVSDREETF